MTARYFAGFVVFLAFAGCGTCLPGFSVSMTTAATDARPGQTVDVTLMLEGQSCAHGGSQIVDLRVFSGGGTVTPSKVTVTEEPLVVKWTLGPAPIAQSMGDARGSQPQVFLTPTVDAPVQPAYWGGVHEWMAANGEKSTTEDLAIKADGTIALGIDNGILELKTDKDGKITITKPKLTGDPLKRAHGIAYDRKGTLWAADPAIPALQAIAPDGTVTTHLKTNGTDPLDAPNYVAVGPKDAVVLSDPCRGELIAYDPSAKKVTDVKVFGLKKEGGPNGFAWNAAGDKLWVVTENITLLCPNAKEKPPVTEPLAGLFWMTWNDGKMGPLQLVEDKLGVFGDGMAFDNEGNLYVVIDTAQGVALEESRVMVLRKGEFKMVPFVAFKKDAIIANVAFGRGPLGETTMYAALLAIPPFTTEDKRGLVKFDVGVKGLPLLP